MGIRLEGELWLGPVCSSCASVSREMHTFPPGLPGPYGLPGIPFTSAGAIAPPCVQPAGLRVVKVNRNTDICTVRLSDRLVSSYRSLRWHYVHLPRWLVEILLLMFTGSSLVD